MSSMNCYRVFVDKHLTPVVKITYTTILALTSIFVVTSNILLIFGILKNYGKKMTISKKLFLFLSASDMLTGVTTVPIQFAMALYGSKATCFLVRLQSFFNTLTPALSMLTILSISIVRFVSVVKPTFYKRHADSPWIFAVMGVQFLLAFLLALWYVTADTRLHLGSFLIFVTVFCCLSIGVSVLLNFVLFMKLMGNSYATSAVKDQKQKTYQKEATKTISIISAILTATYLPNGVMFALVGYYVNKDGSYDLYQIYIPWFFLLMVLNAGINSVVYMWRDNKISRYVKQVIPFKYCLSGRNTDTTELIRNNFNHLRVSIREPSIHSGTGGTSPLPPSRRADSENTPIYLVKIQPYVDN